MVRAEEEEYFLLPPLLALLIIPLNNADHFGIFKNASRIAGTISGLGQLTQQSSQISLEFFAVV